jgi:ABC-type dipeptide/oligopeptide/nickel transport system permease component
MAFVRRIIFLVLLFPALIFFIAFLTAVGQEQENLPAVLVTSADFTVEYLGNLFHGHLGTAAPRYPADPGTPLAGELARALPRSIGLLGVSLVIAVLIGLPLGVAAGLRRKTRFSGALVFVSVLGISTPSYFAAMLLIWFNVWIYQRTGSDLIPVHGFGWDMHLILPALVLAARPTANVMRLGYNVLAEVLDADFVRTAHAKGLAPRVVLFRHVMRNVGVPLMTTIAVSLRFSLAVLPIVEYIFNWSGIGEGLLTAIQSQDATATVAMILPLAVLFVFVNLLLELLYPLVDPRLRTKGSYGA